jgi:hypothetical protein
LRREGVCPPLQKLTGKKGSQGFQQANGLAGIETRKPVIYKEKKTWHDTPMQFAAFAAVRA